jgi:biotin synthase
MLKCFEMLGLTPQKPFTKVSQPTTVEAGSSQFTTWRKTKWSRPGHY